MIKNTHTSSRRRVARFGAAALAAGVLATVATPAFAAPGDGTPGSITVYKLEQPSTSFGPNDGTALDTTGATPLVAGFTACSVDGIDLTKSADWQRLTDLSVALGVDNTPVVMEGATQLTLTCGSEQTTSGTTGETQFSDLASDLAYVVYESTPAANAVSVAQPSLITLPYPGTSGTQWNYNPVIYPKNIVAGSGSTKTADMVGDQVTFTVTVPVMPLSNGENYSEFRINDKLNDAIIFESATVALHDSSGAEVTLDGGDYTLTPAAASTVGGEEVVLSLTASGLAKLDANIGGKIVLTIDGQADGTASTENEAVITVNNKSTDPGTGPQVVDPETFVSKSWIYKVANWKDENQANSPLAGAQFDVYTAAADAVDCPAEPDANETRVFAGLESDANGFVSETTLVEGNYCVYESVTPLGFKPLNGGMLLNVADADSPYVTIVNNQVGATEGDLPSLPITGGSGTVLMMAAGASLLALSAGIFLVARRRREEQPQEA
ncbi:SpaH/EbpB family LPXTG-anchored major pilin [Leucobacter denitrificans]|uniref:SpaH/EbpB family LPXTG-anchored major pilin n=1 Tax=Leucobacter denitrificans TaxID=683042 RepID=A0A7G9S6Z2_9MICO|nr:SpaH/EbpB family LPXTG-anchored major pilin [Leucobacter denitrificans]QNN63617.1 SpaH/EbpB family LPXTG-anchored major pilin [Leucobacter denitrificans]